MTRRLAIVIPAFKGRFLEATLGSIAGQTSRDFTLYVGDDASPDDLAAICARFDSALAIRYMRFGDNLGRHDLVAQWRRCVALSTEPWVWLFGDDDLMPPDGVARVSSAIAADGSRIDLLHLDVDTIDAAGNPVRCEPRFPRRLSAREFLLRRLRFQLSSFAPDYIFARDAYDRCGGFVAFPRAWCSDDATWATLALRGGIRTLDGAPVRWRQSGDNISSMHTADRRDKLQALLDYALWLQGFLRANAARPDEPSNRAILQALPDWFFTQVRNLRIALRPEFAAEVERRLAALPGVSRPGLRMRILWADLRQANYRRRTAASTHD